MLPLKPTRGATKVTRFDVGTTVLPFRVVDTVVRTVVRTTPAVVANLGPSRSRAVATFCEVAPARVLKRPCEPPSLPEVASVIERRSITVPPPPPPLELPITTEARGDAVGGRTCLRIIGLAVLAELVSEMIRLGLAAAAKTAW